MIFPELDSATRAEVLARSNQLRLEAGTEVCEAGGSVGAVRMVREGALVDDSQVELGPGSVVGALDCVRGADHVSGLRTKTVVLVDTWEKQIFLDMIAADERVARAFFTAELSISSQNGSTAAVVSPARSSQRASGSIRDLVERSKQGFRSADARMRAGEGEDGNALFSVLDSLLTDLEVWASSAMTEENRRAATDFLVEELEPYLVRSPLVSALLRHTSPLVDDPLVAETLDRPAMDSGDGLGNALEAWVRNLPGLSVVSRSDAGLVEGCLAEEVENSEILLLATGFTHLGRRLVMRLAECTGLSESAITVVAEQAAAAEQLARFGDGYGSGQRWKGLMWSFARSGASGPPGELSQVDLVLVPHLLEFLPSRHIVQLLTQLRQVLKPGGRVLVSTLSPGADSVFLDAVLGWPTIRRPRPQLLELFLAAGLAIVGEVDCPDPGIVLAAVDLKTMGG